VVDRDILQFVPNIEPLEGHATGYPTGIFVTPDVIGLVGEGTTRQFRDDAHVYDERYTVLNEWAKIALDRCVQFHPTFDLGLVENILDIGCGSGNATFSLRKVFPNAQIFATDISPDMVAILVERAQLLGLSENIIPFISNAEKVQLAPESFDLIFGSSMIHHLIEPDKFLDQIFSSLKRGGICLFTEPFKVGHQVLRFFLSEFSSPSVYSKTIPEDIRKFFKSYIFTIDAMCTLDRSGIDYTELDDKWMFSRRFFEDAGRRNKVSLDFFTTDEPDNRFTANIERLVWLGLGKKWVLPEPARSLVHRFDEAITKDVMDEIPSTGCIIFKKE